MTTLTEEQISDAFHGYLKSSLTQAKVERLLDTDLLSSAEGDLMITGPALCLYFGALRSTTNPPSVPLPRANKSLPIIELSLDNCPPAFRGFLKIWSRNVEPIQSRAPEYQHDLARIICGLPAIASPIDPGLPRIAAELRAVAIEISQRRTFQEKFSSDLQAAIDAGTDRQNGRSKVKASFVPPPLYEEAVRTPTSTTTIHPPAPINGSASHAPLLRHTSSNISLHSGSDVEANEEGGPALTLIRETLYAALGDALVRAPSLRAKMKRDASRAYFALVALAILDVGMSRTHTSTYTSPTSGPESLDRFADLNDDEITVRGVLGHEITIVDCPTHLKPFMRELASIGSRARAMQEADSEKMVQALTSGTDESNLPRPMLERVKRMIEKGVASEEESDDDYFEDSHGSRRSSVAPNGRPLTPQGRALTLANRINALALSMTKLRAFRERQSEVFRVLSGIGS